MNYRKQIEQFIPSNKQEESDQRATLKYIDKYGNNLLSRKNELAHITSSSMIFNNNMDKVLLIYHNIYRSWGWTGGHTDDDGDLLRVAIKEAIEETGVKNFVPLQSEIISLDILPVWGHMKRGQHISSHLHLNVTYPLVANENDKLVVKPDENSAVKWLLIDDLEKHVSEPIMIPVYKKIIERTISKFHPNLVIPA